jgi:hypothetical protein
MKKIDYLLALAITLLCFGVRLYKVDNPVADHHSFRQADTAAVARNFVKDGFNPLFPQSDSLLPLSEHQTPNPNRYFMNEFPLYNSIVAVVYKIWGINTTNARVVSVTFASIGVFFLYLVGKKLFDTKVATMAALFYAILPYNIYYGRVIMPEPTFICFSIVSFYLLLYFVEKPSLLRGLIFSIIFATAMLVKPYAIFLYIPFSYWVLATYGFSAFKKPMFYIAPIISLVPLILWRYHISFYPEGSFASMWLLNGSNIRFTGAFFRWLVFDRMNRLIFATGGFVLLFFGVAHSMLSKRGWLMLFWLISVFAYFSVFAMGNVTHDYYQLPIMPIGALLVSLGFFDIINRGKTIIQKLSLGTLASILLVISLAFGWYEVRGFFNVNDWNMVEAGKRVDEITPKDAIVIAPYQTSPAFLYNTNRHGWTMGYDIEKKIAAGATYYVSTSYDDEAHALEKKYTLVEKNDKFIIIKLIEKTR